MNIKEVVVSSISLIFILIGFVFGLFEARLCLNICQSCSNDQLGPCYFLFLFVGIIFVVCGASLFNNYRDLIKMKPVKFENRDKERNK
jgi:hypothetical protein